MESESDDEESSEDEANEPLPAKKQPSPCKKIKKAPQRKSARNTSQSLPGDDESNNLSHNELLAADETADGNER